MRIGAFIFLSGIIANLVTLASHIDWFNNSLVHLANRGNHQNQIPSFSWNQSHSISLENFGEIGWNQYDADYSQLNSAIRLTICEDTSNTNNSDSSEDQRGSGRIEA